MTYKYHDQAGYILEPLDVKLRAVLVPRVPAKLSTQHLTLLTILWSLLAIGVGFLARDHFSYVVLLAPLVVLQHVTDLLDGAVGRHRNSGYVQWGFYMDHLLDYIFSSCLIIAQALATGRYSLFLVLGFAQSLYFVHSLLMTSLTGRFSVTLGGKVGITEMKLFLVCFYTLAALLGAHFMITIYYVYIPLTSAFLIGLFWKQQQSLAANDMATKQ